MQGYTIDPTPTDGLGAEGIELTILMPCLNEALTVGTCIEKALSFLQRTGIRGEVLIADNGSTDGSQAIASSLGARVVAIPRKGYGAALIGGIEAAHGRFIIMGDADDSYDFLKLDSFVAELRAGHDLVMGNRFRGGIDRGAMPPLHRYLGNPVLTGIGRLFFHRTIGDFHCGLRGFRRDAMLAIGLASSGMEFASEMVAKSALHGLRIAEVSTRLKKDGRDRPPHLRSWRDGWRHLRFMLLFSPNWLFIYPGLIILLLGVLGLITLAHGPAHLGRIELDINTLLYAGDAAGVGSQILTFGLFAKLYSASQGLWPADRFTKTWARLPIELFLLLGGLLTLIGLVWSVYAVSSWGAGHFGPLRQPETLRSLIPAATLMVVGVQWMFFAFLKGLLKLDA
jgi:glycosyltransferase involved in cell wall biosynthesis